MDNILLLEPNYQAKYPPLGLMKIAYYHNYIRKDKRVIFAKGFIEDIDKYSKTTWDRIYISTLFTYEWELTVNAIQYAKKLTKGDFTKILVGGSAATLMPEELIKETGIKPVTGLLNEPYKIGFKDDYIIDNLPPDYSILKQTNYKYYHEKSYFAFTTRGCGMNCSFCAVNKLEPHYMDYIPIKAQINAVRKMDKADTNNGELKRDLLLLDNNVLKSKKFKDIVNDIKDLGFGKGATFINQLTGKTNQRFVDFNQGLDAKLLTEEKAKLLGRLALRPVRIAFDHIEDSEIYKNAIKRCYKNGLTEFSNYILYNTDQTNGKGKRYDADKPEDLYKRLRITVDLKEDINSSLCNSNYIKIYSFPMRYIPLNNKVRDYVGFNWNKKFLRAIRIMLTPTQGKGVSGKDFFEAAFGKSESEFKMFLLMPESLLLGRGKIVNSSENPLKNEEIKRTKINHKECYQEWVRLFRSVKEKESILEIIKDNCFTQEIYFSIKYKNLKLLYLYYLTPSQILNMFSTLEDKEERELIRKYLTEDAPFYFRNILEHAIAGNYHYNQLNGLVNIFHEQSIIQLVQIWLDRKCADNDFPKNLHNLYIQTNITVYIKPSLLTILKHYVRLDILTDAELAKAKEYISCLDIKNLKILLSNKFPDLQDELKKKLLAEKFGASILKPRLEKLLKDIETELSIKEAY